MTFAAGLTGGFLLRAMLRRHPQVVALATPASPQSAGNDHRFDALARALPIGIVMLDGNLRVQFVNRAAGAIFGFDDRRAVGTHVIAAIPSVEIERRANAALTGELDSAPLSVTSVTGKRTYAVALYPLTDEAERTVGVLLTAVDRTGAAALERARAEFLTNVSHELRTPLSSVKLMLETVMQSGDDQAAAIFLPQALDEVDRLADLVQRMLAQARVESGELHLQIEEIDLEEIAHGIVRSFEPQAASKRVTIELRALRPMLVEADAQRLAQVFVNLIDNAMRYSSEGGNITIELDIEDAYATIRVRDTGVGIPYRDLPYVFERFYVVDRSRSRVIGGAGLGLSIVKQIAEAHRGTVAVDSMLGVGTTFTVRIPVVAVTPD